MKMTQDRKRRAYALLMQGCTVHQIADAMGVDAEGLARYMLHMDTAVSRKCVYPAIAEWLRAHNMTHAELAEAAGVSYQTISNMLVGRNQPRTDTCIAIMRVTGMSFGEAFEEGGANEHRTQAAV